VESGNGGRASTPGLGRRYVLAAALLWSLGGVFAKSLALDGLTIAFYRGLFAGLVLLPMVPRSRRALRPSMLPLGLCFGAMTGLYIAAIKATTAANAIFLQCTSTFWTIPLSAWLLRERPDRRSVLGIGLATLGIAAIVLYGYDGRPNEGRGIALGLASGLGYAGVTIGLRGLRDLDPVWLSAINNLLGALALGLWAVATVGPIARPDGAQALVLIAFGVLQMAIPYALFARGLRDIGAPEAGLIALLEPALNPIWVVLIHGERPAPATLVGGLFLLAGVACKYVPRRGPEKRAGDRSPAPSPHRHRSGP
jgi:drug/metabolite transporter (DMT)-like permease